MSQSVPLVEMTGISIEFPGVKALQEVDFRLFPGEVHALMGENGAGKSTLIKALTGVYKFDAGRIVVGGKPTVFSGTADAQAAGIATVYQEVNLCANLSIGENVMLGREVRGKFGINWAKTHELARQALAKLDIYNLDPRASLGSISIALQQLVAIARTTVIDAKVLILDEPTSSLDDNEVAHLFQLVRKLRDQGVAILFVSHFLDQVYDLSDRMTVLRNGALVGEYMTAELPRMELIAKMIGKDLKTLSSLSTHARERSVDTDGTPLLKVLHLSSAGKIESTDLEIYQGDVIGFAGLLGSGRTELARLLYGADRPTTGTLEIKGKVRKLSSAAAALKANIAYSTENRRDEGIIGDLTVRENIILAMQATQGWIKPIPRSKQDALAKQYIEALNIRPPDPEALIKNLSGGNQQKVLLARWLATQPELLILDEPTRGIDVGAKTEIQRLVLSLADQGMAVVFISSELEEVVRLSDRIVVLKDRRSIAELANSDGVTAQSIVSTIAAEGGAE